jgi:hypothetical protein
MSHNNSSVPVSIDRLVIDLLLVYLYEYHNSKWVFCHQKDVTVCCGNSPILAERGLAAAMPKALHLYCKDLAAIGQRT